jgi:iron complex outermembrane recepter protein
MEIRQLNHQACPPGICCRQRLPARHASLLCFIAGLLTCLLAPSATWADSADTIPADSLMDMSLEALMNIEVTSVSRRPQKKSGAAAAIFVITSEDLRRWGVTNIPDALRRVPGIQVARIDANKWAITARGFNSRFANKLLVMIDGRSIYTPLFAGVYWEANEVMLDDVDRIEVIRGPGGTLWGANAVNGVINIITRSAADTQGSLIAAGTGNEERGDVSFRYGGSNASGGHYRVYGKYRSVDTGEAIDTGMFPPVAHDDSMLQQGGFRMDWGKDTTDRFTFQGDAYHVNAGQELLIASASPYPLVEDARYNGHNLLYRWSHRNRSDSDYSLQAWYDHVGLDSTVLFENRDTLDLDFQHHLQATPRQDLVWGLNFRTIHDHTGSTPTFALNPASRTVNLYTAFVQDEIALLDERAHLTLGSKFEHNDFTGFEVQPNVRMTWQTRSGNTVWGAISRAVRTPARGEHDVTLAVIAPSLPPPLTIQGNDEFRSETLIAYEIGYRFSLAEQVSTDITTFYNDYNKLRTVDITTATPPYDATFGNNLEGHTAGIEIDSHWQAREWLGVNANYSQLKIDLRLVNGSSDTLSQAAADASPAHTANLWIAADLDKHVEIDAGVRYVSRIRTPGASADIPSYTAFDARIGWKPRADLELSLSARNLFDNTHPEFNPDFIYSLPTEVQRSIYGKVTLKF